MNMTRILLLSSIVLILSTATVYSEDVGRGKSLFNDSSLGTNGKSCNSCHSNGKDINAGKKAFNVLGTEQDSIEGAANFCIRMALSGEPLEEDSEKMKDLAAYLESLKGNKTRGSETPGY